MQRKVFYELYIHDAQTVYIAVCDLIGDGEATQKSCDAAKHT